MKIEHFALNVPDPLAMALWYDAIDTISGLLESNPNEQELRELRADLLDQGDLVAIADIERSFGTK